MVILSTITAGDPARTYKTARDNKDLYRSAEVKRTLSPGASTERGKEKTVYGTCDSGSSSAVPRLTSEWLVFSILTLDLGPRAGHHQGFR